MILQDRDERMPLKAELHCHIEGAAAPELVMRQAEKYGKDISPFIQNGSFVWNDFTSFLAAYDFASDLFRSEDDYAKLADTVTFDPGSLYIDAHPRTGRRAGPQTTC